MAYTQVITPAEVRQPPIVAELERIFASLDDAPLLEALQGPTRRGPKGHSVQTLWRCLVAKYVLGLASTRALIRTLEDNPFIAEVCGIASPNTIPHEATFSRFFTKLSKYETAARVKDVSRSLVRRFYSELPGIGKRIAIDSTTLKGWSNGAKGNKADKEAGWSVKKGTQGKQEFTWGYKLHLAVDTEYELPLAANVSPGNVHDSRRASNLLSEARFTNSAFGPRYVIADQAYSGLPLRHVIVDHYHAKPIIETNKVHKRLKAKQEVFEGSPEWKAIYRQRSSVERVFSRLKGQRALNRITVRGLWKVTAHCYLALIAMQASRVHL